MAMAKASRRYFEQVAEDWDTIRGGYFSEDVRQNAISKAYLRPEMMVADVGAGSGFMAAGLAPLVSKVHVLDGSPAMLDEARKNLAGAGNLEFHIADGLALPLPDGSMDAVFANMYLHHCTNPLAAIVEMARILKPGGRLVITDMETHTNEWMKAEMADEWLGFERGQVHTWFKEAGLVNILVGCSGQSCCVEADEPAPGRAQGQVETISIFTAVGTRRIKMREAVKEAYSAAAQSGCCGGEQVDSESQSGQSDCCCGGEQAGSVSKSGQSSCCGGEQAGSESQSGQSDCCCGGEQAGSETKSWQSDCCCGGDDSATMTQGVAFKRGYSNEEFSQAPAEAGEISLGCGNPIAMANLRPGEVVLDIGSGGGMDSFLAAARVGATGRVIGVDMTPAMLERATRSAEKAGIKNVEFRKGHAEELPAQDASVDVVLSNCVINLCEDKGLVFQEAYRVLKPGGRLEVSDMVSSAGLPDSLRQDAGEWAGCISGALPEGEYLDLAAGAGFVDLAVRRSASAGTVGGVEVYSVIVSARKEDPQNPGTPCAQTGCCG